MGAVTLWCRVMGDRERSRCMKAKMSSSSTQAGSDVLDDEVHAVGPVKRSASLYSSGSSPHESADVSENADPKVGAIDHVEDVEVDVGVMSKSMS